MQSLAHACGVQLLRAPSLRSIRAAASCALRAQSYAAKGRSSRRMKGPPSRRIGNKRVLDDYYFKEAKRLDYLSRAAFKLLQIDDKFGVLRKGGTVLDLGCFPGAWLQVATQRMGSRERGGRVVGIDLKEMDVPVAHCDERVTVLNGDALDLSKRSLQALAPDGFDTVLSDMCHDTMGFDFADVALSLQLCECAAKIAVGSQWTMTEEDYAALAAPDADELREWHVGVLRRGGALVMKVLEGSGRVEFSNSLRPFFQKVAFLRPKATRSESREMYIVCLGRK